MNARPWRMLVLLSGAQLLGMSLWFTASAVAPQLAALWSLTPGQAGALTTAVQIGFVAGTAFAAALNLADIVPARVYFAATALLAALVNLALLGAPGYEAALGLRFLTGFFLAGVYPPAMKMVATWFRERRGLAIGVMVGALAVGKAIPFLVGAFTPAGLRFVVWTTSAGAVAAAILVLAGYRDGPFPFARRPFQWALVATVLRHRPTRLAIYGYLGHMWELYAAWTVLTLFLHHHLLLTGATPAAATTGAGVLTFLAIAGGGPGSALAGAWADRWGRERVAGGALVVSGACALTVGWLAAAPTALLVPLVLLWGVALVADSAQFSALVTETAPAHAVGTALTLQTCLGFALTAGSIWLAVELATRVGWGVAFAMLAVGPALGIVAMARLDRLRRPAGGSGDAGG